MHHKDLPLPGFFTLLQSKLSLDCFDSVPRLSCPLSLTQKWLAGHGSRCIPGPAYLVQHFLNSGGIFLPQTLVLFACFSLQLFPHPLLHSCILPSTASSVLSTLSSPQFHTVQPHEPQKLPVLQCCSCSSDLCLATLLPSSNSAPGSALLFPTSMISRPPHVFPFPKLLLFILLFGSGVSMAVLASRLSHSCAGSGLMAELLWALLNQSSAFIGH